MRALILCAGHGTRLGKLTKNTPKCMLKVGGKPVLEHLVDHLKKYGITEIIVNLHHKPEKIMNYFGTRLLYFYEPELLGEDGTVKALKKWLENDWFVVMNGDTLTNVEIDEMLKIGKEQNVAVAFGGDDVVDGRFKYAGTCLHPPNWFKSRKGINTGGKSVLEHETWGFQSDAFWFDIGTPEGLKKARRYYEKMHKV